MMTQTQLKAEIAQIAQAIKNCEDQLLQLRAEGTALKKVLNTKSATRTFTPLTPEQVKPIDHPFKQC